MKTSSKIEIHGTSTLHDWMMSSEFFNVDIERDGEKITKLIVSLPILSLKSGDSALDETAYKAIYKAGVKKGEDIVFSLNSHNEDGTINGVFLVGNYQQEGIILPDVLTENAISGALKINMSSFGIKAPTFLFGLMCAGDEVVIKYLIEL